ncbi:putative MEAB protein [Tirmania nivea]|nr:putative MEAB protein [Tirmania nivea]
MFLQGQKRKVDQISSASGPAAAPTRTVATMAAVKTSPQPSEPSSASSPESSVQFPIQKRKGGRKPVYATQEERKMRNRAAQAAFRERRTEYIKHLEATIKHHEEQLSSLQQSSRNAAEEVLMLRYKTSLLERILLEKGIDVQSELRAFSQGEPTPAPTAPMGTVSQQHRQQPHHPVHQQQMHRQSISRAVPKRGSVSQQTPDAIYIKPSPIMQPTPVSRAPSPHANSSAIPTPPEATTTSFVPHSVVSTPAPDFVSPGGGNNSGCMSIPHNYYPSPYQQHMEELGKLPLVLLCLLYMKELCSS